MSGPELFGCSESSGSQRTLVRMQSLAAIKDRPDSTTNGKTLAQRTGGVFYTHEVIGTELASSAADELDLSRDQISILDPFGGDGRLVRWLIEELARRGVTRFDASIWEIDPAAAAQAAASLDALGSRLGIEIENHIWVGDSFQRGCEEPERWQAVVTNPPWELLKPDRREIEHLTEEGRSEYISSVQALDDYLRSSYPEAEPRRRFAGWGMNLSRAGTSLAMRLTQQDGVTAAVCPASLFADASSGNLRRWIFDRSAITHLSHYPAEARLFKSVDVPSCTFVAVSGRSQGSVSMGKYDASAGTSKTAAASLDLNWLESRDFSIPVQYGSEGLQLLRDLGLRSDLIPLGDYQAGDLWLGREIDETRRATFVKASGGRQLIRSRHVHRLGPIEDSGEFLDEVKKPAPVSADRLRIAWRDISRPSQRRRIHATILEPGPVSGNSVGIGYLKAGSRPDLLALLGLISSIPFEFQVRAGLMTNHVSAAALRSAKVPQLSASQRNTLAAAVQHCLSTGTQVATAEIERLAADAYNLGPTERQAFGRQFDLLDHERSALLAPGYLHR